MPRLRAVRRRELVKALKENGLVESTKRGKGSHTWWEHPDDSAKATSVPASATLPIGTVDAILAGAGKDRKLYHDRFRGAG